jgi:hypothetical protein
MICSLVFIEPCLDQTLDFSHCLIRILSLDVDPQLGAFIGSEHHQAQNAFAIDLCAESVLRLQTPG